MEPDNSRHFRSFGRLEYILTPLFTKEAKVQYSGQMWLGVKIRGTRQRPCKRGKVNAEYGREFASRMFFRAVTPAILDTRGPLR